MSDIYWKICEEMVMMMINEIKIKLFYLSDYNNYKENKYKRKERKWQIFYGVKFNVFVKCDIITKREIKIKKNIYEQQNQFTDV